jgi:asparagine synthase (glutamine-hydrolysing)
LRSTPEAGAVPLPFESSETGCVITSDARIDNRDELTSALRIHHDARKTPDGILILRAYEKWGASCVDHLLGAFAFVIWDPREQHLFCALDHFGVKPFYFYHGSGELFAFASEIKGLHKLNGVPKELDDVRIAEHLLAPVEDNVTRTYFKQIRRLKPAHTLTVTLESAKCRQYWDLNPDREIQLPEHEYADRFRDLFEEAVRARVRSPGPVGSMLSGGLDSSAVACQAARVLQESGSEAPLQTYSAVFDADARAARSDEREYIDAVLEAYGAMTPHFIRGDMTSPLDDWDELYQYVDGACTANNAYIFWRSHRRAHDEGVRVMLDGFDGDTTVSHGIGFLNQLRERGRLLKLAIESGQLARRKGESVRGVMQSWLKGPIFSLPILSQLVEARQVLKNKFGDDNGQHADPPPQWRRVLSKDLIQSVESHIGRERTPMPPTEREYHYRQLKRPVMKRILDLWSYFGAGSSIDVRYPFYDKRLVEFCLALPPEQKLRNGWSRRVMRNALEGILPPSVQWREGKGDLSHGFDYGMATYEKPLLEQLKESKIGGVDRFVSREFLRQAVPKYLEGKVGTGNAGPGLAVWRALSLSLWLRHLEGEA